MALPLRSARQGILRFVYRLADRFEKRLDVTARAGLPLVLETMRALGLDELADRDLPATHRCGFLAMDRWC